MAESSTVDQERIELLHDCMLEMLRDGSCSVRGLKLLELAMMEDSASRGHSEEQRQTFLSRVFNPPGLYERDSLLRYFGRRPELMDVFLKYRAKEQWPDDIIVTVCFDFEILKRIIDTDPRVLGVLDVKFSTVDVSIGEMLLRDLDHVTNTVWSWIVQRPDLYMQIDAEDREKYSLRFTEREQEDSVPATE